MSIKKINSEEGKLKLDNPNDLLKKVGDQICINFKDGISKLDNEIQDNFHQILKGTKLSNRIIFIRHGQTSLEGTDQPDDINILPQEHEKIQELNEKILKAGLGNNNVYFLSNNRTARIEQTADKIIKGLDLYYGRTDVSFLDTTNKQIKKNVRIAMINGLSSILVDQIIDLVKGTENIQIISVIHSSNQNSIEGYLQTNPFKKNEKLKNLGTLTIDLNDKGIIDYSINEGFQLTQDNFQLVRNNLDELSKYGNKDIIDDIAKYFDGEEYSIIDKQNILNYYLFRDSDLIENIVSKGTHIGLVLKSLNLLVNKYGKFENRFNKKYFENILILLKNSSNAEIWELIKIIKDKSYENKILYWIESEIGFDNEFIAYLSKSKDTESKLLLKKIKKIKKTILGKKIMFGLFICMFLLSMPSGYYLYDNNKFIQTFKNNPEDLTKLQFNDFNYKNLENYGNINIDLSGIKSLDSKQAYYLMQMNFQVLDLSGLELLTDETAQELSKFKGAILKLNGLTTITSMQFEKISTFCTKLGGVIQLNSLEKVDYETMIKITNFEGKEIQLKSLTFQYDLPNFLLINSFEKYGEFVISNSKHILSDEYYIEMTRTIIDDKKFEGYKKDMMELINKERKNFIYDSEQFSMIVIDKDTINNLKSINFECDDNCNFYIRQMIDYFYRIKLPLKNYLKLYLKDFFKQEIIKFIYYDKENIEKNISGFIRYFEDEFLKYLKSSISQDEYELLEKKLYESENELEYKIAQKNYNKRYLGQITNSDTFLNKKLDLNENTVYSLEININNDLLIGKILNELEKSKIYNIKLITVNKLSNIKSNLDRLNIGNLVANIKNIDTIPTGTKAQNIIINNEKILRSETNININHYPFDLEINFELKDSGYFYTFYSGLIDNLRKVDSVFKGLKIGINGSGKIYESLKLSDIMKLSKLNCDNLYLGKFNFNKTFTRKFAGHFGTAGKRVTKWEYINIKEHNGIEKEKGDQYLNSVKDKYPIIEIFQNYNLFDMMNLNIFNGIIETDGVAKFQVNKSLYFSGIESIELDSFTILKNANINILFDLSNYNNNFPKNITIKLIINTENENLQQEIEEFIIYFKILSSTYYVEDYFKFDLIFEGKRNQEIIDLFKSCNMLYENSTDINQIPNGQE